MSWVPKNNLAHGANYRGQPPESRVTGVLNRIASLWIPPLYMFLICIAWGWPGRDQQGRSAMIQQCHISTLEPPYQSDSCKQPPACKRISFWSSLLLRRHKTARCMLGFLTSFCSDSQNTRQWTPIINLKMKFNQGIKCWREFRLTSAIKREKNLACSHKN